MSSHRSLILSVVWGKRMRTGAGLVVVLGLVGFTTDLFSGLPLTRGSTSWVGWLLGILGLGVLYLIGEGAAEWIHGRDAVTDPLWLRALHLGLLLAAVLVLMAASISILSRTR